VSATEESPTGSRPLGADQDTGGTAYQQVQRTPEFAALRKRWRFYIFLMSGLFLAWFLVYVLLADFAHDVVNARIGDTNFTVGLLQFVSTFAITMAYVRYADRNLDPEAEALRRRVEEKL